MIQFARPFETVCGEGRVLAEGQKLAFRDDPADSTGEEGNLLNLYDQVQYQSILGFGGAFTEATALNFAALSPQRQREFLTAYFDREEGIGYNFCRTTINSCDFAAAPYSCDDVDGDFGLEHFSIDHDGKHILPLIRQARELSPDLLLFASPWSPPAWMKTTGKMNDGGELRRECYDVWARFFARYIEEYGKAGAPIWGVTVQNEAKAVQTWESCVYSAGQERDFVLGHLRPALEEAGLGDRKIFFWDHNKERTVERALETMGSDRARAAVDGIAVHWYSGDHFDALSVFHDLFPEKTILATEHCVGRSEEGKPWGYGEAYAHDIIGDLNNHASAWVDWNMLLDEVGAPFHWRGGICEAPILRDSADGKLVYQSHWAYIGHFSRFIRRGARRIGYSLFTARLEACAFRNPDGQIVVVLLNAGDRDETVRLRLHGRLTEYRSRAHSIATFLIDDER